MPDMSNAPVVQQPAPVVQDPNAVPQIPIYDMTGNEPVLGSIDPSEVTQAVAAGTHSLPSGTPISVISPDGIIGTMDPSEAPQAFNNGYRYATPHDTQLAKYSTPGQKALTLLEGLGSGATFGLSDAVEMGQGVKAEDIRGRRETNPGYNIAGQIGSLIIPGAPEAEALHAAGNGLYEALAGEGLLRTIGARTASEAAQMALIQAGDETSKLITQDPNTSVESAVSDVGLAAVLGGSFGAAIGSVSPLWKATVGNKVGQVIEDFKGRMNYHLTNPNPVDNLVSEMGNHYNTVKGMADDVYGAAGLKAQDIAKSMPEMSDAISTQATSIGQDVKATVDKMVKKPDSYPARLSSKLLDDFNTYDKAVANAQSPDEIFNAAQDLKQTLQGYSKYDRFVKPVDEAYDFVKDAKDLAFKVRNSLEDPTVWGKAAERQQAINKAFVQFKPALEDFEKKFTTEVSGDRVIDPGKVNTYLNQLGKPNAEIKQKMLSNWLEASDKYMDTINQSHKNLGIESEVPKASVSAMKESLEKETTGAKLADIVVRKGLSNIAGEGLGAAVGGIAGHTMGMGGIGALVGEHALGPFFSSVLPALAKPIIEMANNANGLKSATDYGMSVTKGALQATKAVKNIFKAGTQVLPQSLQVTQRDRDKLNKSLMAIQDDPRKLMNVGGDIGHYLPGHGTAMAAMATKAANLLNSLRPATTPALPLDAKIVPSVAQTNAFNKILDVAQQPLTVLDSLQKGTLTHEQITVMQELYPNLYQHLQQKLTNEVISMKSKGQMIPYTTRLNLSLFMGQPLDSTMTPQAILAAQPTPSQQSPQGGNKTTKAQGEAMNKLSQSAMTPSQASAQHKVEKV